MKDSEVHGAAARAVTQLSTETHAPRQRMVRGSFRLLALGTVCALAFWISSRIQQSPNSALSIDSQNLNLGELWEGSVVTHHFRVRNMETRA